MASNTYKSELRFSIVVLNGLTIQVFLALFIMFALMLSTRLDPGSVAPTMVFVTALGAVIVVSIKYAALWGEYENATYRLVGDRVDLEEDGTVQLSVPLADVVAIVLRQSRWQRRHGLGSIYLATSVVLPRRLRIISMDGQQGGGLVIPDVPDSEGLFTRLQELKFDLGSGHADPVPSPAALARSHKPVFILSSVFWDLSPQILFMAVWWTGVLASVVGLWMQLAFGLRPKEFEPLFIYLIPLLAAAVICFFGVACDAVARKYRRTTYRVGEEHIETEEEGLIWKERRSVRFADISEVTLHRNLWQRRRGLGTVYGETSGGVVGYRATLLGLHVLGGAEHTGVLLQDIPDAAQVHAQLAASRRRARSPWAVVRPWRPGPLPEV